LAVVALTPADQAVFGETAVSTLGAGVHQSIMWADYEESTAKPIVRYHPLK
jgi:hypothetical protein